VTPLPRSAWTGPVTPSPENDTVPNPPAPPMRQPRPESCASSRRPRRRLAHLVQRSRCVPRPGVRPAARRHHPGSGHRRACAYKSSSTPTSTPRAKWAKRTPPDVRRAGLAPARAGHDLRIQLFPPATTPPATPTRWPSGWTDSTPATPSRAWRCSPMPTWRSRGTSSTRPTRTRTRSCSRAGGGPLAPVLGPAAQLAGGQRVDPRRRMPWWHAPGALGRRPGRPGRAADAPPEGRAGPDRPVGRAPRRGQRVGQRKRVCGTRSAGGTRSAPGRGCEVVDYWRNCRSC
jgi:hypothetical protein